MKFKKVIAGALAFAVMLNTLHVSRAEQIVSEQPTELSMLQNNMEVSGTNSFGDMVAKELAAVSGEQEANNGCNVFSVEMNGAAALVSFETTCDSALVVAVYDNEGINMIGSGYTEVTAEETEAEVTVEAAMPQYFYIRAYLVNPDTLRPLCTEYSSPMYTREMQEFLSKTTEDFDSDRVLNFDDNPDTNFAVFSEDTTLIHEIGKTNVVVSADEAAFTYVFKNPDESLSALETDGIFAFEYNDELIILKAVSVEKTVDKDTGKVTSVTVVGQEAELEEAFEHLRIDGESKTEDAIIDDSDLEDGVTYEGLEEENDNSGIAPTAIDLEGKATYTHKFAFERKGEYKDGNLTSEYSISAGLNIKLEPSVKVYISFSEIYVEVKMDYTFKVNIEFEGNVRLSVPLMYFAFSPVPGVYISITPSFILGFDGTASVDGKLYGSFGFKSTTSGIDDLTKKPKFSLNGKVEVSFYVGVSLEPKVAIISEKIAEASVKAEAVAKITAKIEKSTENDENIQHACDMCIDGDIDIIFSGDISAKLLNNDKWKFSLTFLDKTIHLFDFYYSITFNEFAFTECPHIRYLEKIKVRNNDPNNVSGVKIATDEDDTKVFTDERGEANVWLSKGKHKIELEADGYKPKSSSVNVKEGGQTFKVTIDKLNDNSASDLLGDILDQFKNGTSDPNDLDYGKIWGPKVKIAGSVSSNWFVIVDGTLYMCYGGCTGAKKIADNIVSASCMSDSITNQSGYSCIVAKTSNNDLIKYDYNTINNRPSWMEGEMPFEKILGNVESAEFYSTDWFVKTCAAITNDGSLYTWGQNENGRLGRVIEGSSDDTPVKIMNNIKSVKLGNTHCAAITNDGRLYMWGNNEYGQLGNGTNTDSNVPVEVMDNVASVYVNYALSIAVTTNGDLYIWGREFDSNVPIKVLNNVKSVNMSLDSYYDRNIFCIITALDVNRNLYRLNLYTKRFDKILNNIVSTDLSMYTGAAITAEGVLYTFGVIGTSEETPQKIMDNVKFVKLCSNTGAAITYYDSLYMWGDNSYGKLGDGTTNKSSIPIRILDNVKNAESGDKSSIAIMEDGNVYTWGGSIGNHVPTKVTFPTDEKSNNPNSVTIPTPYYSTPNTSAPSSITSLLPNEVYNIYSVTSRTVNKELASDNLLYIGQAVSDSSGTLTIPSAVGNGTVFVKAMSEFDVYNAAITSVSVNGESVALEWEPVEGASEYEVYCYTPEGILSQVKTSANSLTVSKLEKGKYYGFLVTSIVHGEQSVPAINDVRMVEIPKGVLGDLNGDTKVTIADARLLLQAASGSRTLTAEQEALADVNKDGKVNITDARWLLQVASGSRVL